MVLPVSRWGRCFPCMPPCERQCDKWLADANYGGLPGIPVGLIQLEFVAHYPLTWEWRLAKYVQVRRLTIITVTIGDNEVQVYQANRAWMTALFLDLLSGAVSVDMPFPCQRLRFVNLPE